MKQNSLYANDEFHYKMIKLQKAILTAVNMKNFKIAIFYILVLVILTLFKMVFLYSYFDTSKHKVYLDNKLMEVQQEVYTLENSVHSSTFDLNYLEEKSKEIGLVKNERIEYLKY